MRLIGLDNESEKKASKMPKRQHCGGVRNNGAVPPSGKNDPREPMVGKRARVKKKDANSFQKRILETSTGGMRRRSEREGRHIMWTGNGKSKEGGPPGDNTFVSGTVLLLGDKSHGVGGKVTPAPAGFL